MVQDSIGDLIWNSLVTQKSAQRPAQVVCAHVRHAERRLSIAPHGH